MTTTRRLLVVEDELLVAALIRDVLLAADFAVETADSVTKARALIRSFDPDAVLLDIGLGDGPSGLDLAHALHRQRPDIAIIFLTRHPDTRTAGITAQEIPAGAGFLRKDMVTDTKYLLAAINEVLANRPLGVRHDLDHSHPLRKLTPTQLAVLRQAAGGMSNSAIARQRNITERTVELHLQAACRALGIEANPDINPRVEVVRRYFAAAGVPSRRDGA